MSLENKFPVLSGAQQEKRKQKIENELKKEGESFFERILKGGKKIAAPAIATLIALGSVKEGKSQSKTENIKRVPSLEQVTSMSKDKDTLSVQENDSTVHMYQVKRRGKTTKLKDLGTMTTTKGDAIKVEDLKQNQDIAKKDLTQPEVRMEKENKGIFYFYPGHKKSNVFSNLQEAQADAKKRGLSTDPKLFYSDSQDGNQEKRDIKKDMNEKSVGSGPFWYEDKKGTKHRFSNFPLAKEARDKDNPNALITKD